MIWANKINQVWAEMALVGMSCFKDKGLVVLAQPGSLWQYCAVVEGAGDGESNHLIFNPSERGRLGKLIRLYKFVLPCLLLKKKEK